MAEYIKREEAIEATKHAWAKGLEPSQYLEIIPAANVAPVQEWIPVNDRLPENDQWALCFMKNKSFRTFCVFQWNYIDWYWNDGNEWFNEKDVAYWMPLPLPPKAE